MREAPFGLGSGATAEADRSEVSWIHESASTSGRAESDTLGQGPSALRG